MLNRKKVVCLPVEVFKREFSAKIYLALKLINRGYAVIIGNHDNIVFDSVTSGFYLHKDHATWSNAKIKKLKEQGLVIGALDEEGIIYRSEDIYLNHRAPAGTLSMLDVVFLWGEEQKKLIDKRKVGIRKEIVGNPRFDILELYRRGVSRRKDHFSKILINTRFPLVNNVRGDREMKNLMSLGIISDEKDYIEYRKVIEGDKRIYDEFCSLVDLLSKEKDVTITVRPHPAERAETYESIFSHLKNVFVDNHTSLPDQLVAHDCLIHDGCTTAIEAAAVGIPVLGLRPRSVTYSYGEFANRFSVNFTTHQELADYLRHTSPAAYRHPQESDVYASSVISNWKNASHSAIDRMVDVIDSLDIKEVALEEIVDKWALDKSFLLRKYSESISMIFEGVPMLKKFLIMAFGERGERIISEIETKHRKFPSLSNDTIDSLLLSLCNMDRSLGDTSGYVYQMKSRRAIMLWAAG